MVLHSQYMPLPTNDIQPIMFKDLTYVSTQGVNEETRASLLRPTTMLC